MMENKTGMQELFEICKKYGVDLTYHAHTKEIEVTKFLVDATGEFHIWYEKSVYLYQTSKSEEQWIEELICFIEEKENPKEEEAGDE